ncbi:hypothetical protein HDU84_004514 [Entophlyctis sp. JEL0112]|nr:hypothetical protein HDU84_004514 [Entophlyctis sp. JEL0112]
MTENGAEEALAAIANNNTTLSHQDQGLSIALDSAKTNEVISILDDGHNNSGPEQAPDGGFTAWATVFASFVVHFLALGPLYSFGIYAAEYHEAQLSSLTVITFIGSIGSAALVGFGILSGRLAERFGFRLMIFVGACVNALGLVLASFCTNSSWQLMITQGLLFGLGTSLSYFPAVSVPSQWFNKKRSIATGIAGTVFSPQMRRKLIVTQILQALISHYGVPWTLRASAAMNFVGIVGVLPLLKTRFPPLPGSRTDWSVLSDLRFALLVGTVFFATFASFIPVTYLPIFAETAIGSSASQGAALVSIYNGASALGRIAMGALADTLLGRVNCILLSVFISMISMWFLWTFANSFALLAVFAVINGLVAGGFISIFPVVVGQTFGLKRLPSLVGMIMSLSAIANLAGSPLAGVVEGAFGLTGVCVFAGALTFLSVVFCSILRYISEPSLWKRV